MNKSTQKVCLLSLGAIAGCFAAGLSLTLSVHSFAKDSSNSVPTPAVRQQLASQSLQHINRAVLSGDFATFRSTLSPIWQSQVTVPQVEQLMQPLVVNNVDFSEAEKLEARFSGEPKIDEEGALILTGEFPADPLRAMFEFRYFQHDGDWKLLGFHVMRKAHPKAIPSSVELASLSKSALHEFAEAVESDDFTNFHSTLVSMFQDKTSPESLRNSFRVFMNRKINLQLEGNFYPIVTTAPVLSAEGIMTVQGHYNTRVHKVDFTLDFIPEDNEWKLLEIKVAANPR